MCLKWTIDGHLCLLHQIYQGEMDQRLLSVKPLRLPHRNGLTCPCVYYTTVTALKWTKTLLFLLNQSYRTEMDKRALAFITGKLPH